MAQRYRSLPTLAALLEVKTFRYQLAAVTLVLLGTETLNMSTEADLLSFGDAEQSGGPRQRFSQTRTSRALQ